MQGVQPFEHVEVYGAFCCLEEVDLWQVRVLGVGQHAASLDGSVSE